MLGPTMLRPFAWAFNVVNSRLHQGVTTQLCENSPKHVKDIKMIVAINCSSTFLHLKPHI